ncbi:unnamed protein product [Amoebophrya sp. A25]|nr:unnamed protein product [Amoebophrya sp. A25]|eukprot:GSA25T00026655001.1
MRNRLQLSSIINVAMDSKQAIQKLGSTFSKHTNSYCQIAAACSLDIVLACDAALQYCDGRSRQRARRSLLERRKGCRTERSRPRCHLYSDESRDVRGRLRKRDLEASRGVPAKLKLILCSATSAGDVFYCGAAATGECSNIVVRVLSTQSRSGCFAFRSPPRVPRNF